MKKLELDSFLSDLTQHELSVMADAASEAEECIRVVHKTGRNMIHETTAGGNDMKSVQHYPKGDIIDFEYGSHLYFHSHRSIPEEFGHFHTFGYPLGLVDEKSKRNKKTNAHKSIRERKHAHIVAISIDRFGNPINLFTTNRWVTEETIYPEEYVIKMLDQFKIDHAGTSWALNRWATAILKLFRPQIVWLISQRDSTLQEWKDAHPQEDVYEDKSLEVLADIDISVKAQSTAVNKLLKKSIN